MESVIVIIIVAMILWGVNWMVRDIPKGLWDPFTHYPHRMEGQPSNDEAGSGEWTLPDLSETG